MTFNLLVTLAFAVGTWVAMPTAGQVSYECPSDWETNRGYCYKFEANSPADHDKATAMCNVHGAGLLSVTTPLEHSFVVTWLQRYDPFQRDWYTSGTSSTATNGENGPVFVWQSSGHPVEAFSNTTWLDTPRTGLTSALVYTLGEPGWGWKQVDPYVERAFVCKISVEEAYRIHNSDRDFGYGVKENNPDLWETGPRFFLEPHSLVVLMSKDQDTEPDHRQTASATLECAVQSNPPSTYKWFRGRNLDQEITGEADSRYTITNGRVEIRDPRETKDATFYRCEAENKFGKVLSNAVEISFGNLGEFSNVQNSVTVARAYEGARIECSKITYIPAVAYQWMKGRDMRFVRPQYQTYIFISNNGKLYFSEVTRNDEDEYQCIAALRGVNDFVIGSSQPPMRTSLPIPLMVQDQAPKAIWGPIIQDEFIAVFPNPPVRGQDIRMECFAYGSVTSPFFYRWSRDDKPMPPNAKTSDHNRVLVLSNAQLEDSGIYRCTVGRGRAAKDTKTVSLVLSSKPYFVNPLRDQHVDVGSQLTWICGARGNPQPSYRWYRNGELLTSQSDQRISVQRNVLTISHLDKELHDGMYQCEAFNNLGSSFSNGQLRVLTIPPNFFKQQTRSQIMGPLTGNVTLMCQPEGAPYPTIEWQFEGSPIQADGTKRIISGTGNLHITALSDSDRGSYTCTATNIYGEASTTTELDVTEGTTITFPPIDTEVIVNSTAVLDCHASFPANMDTIYEWTFYDYPVDFRESHFALVRGANTANSGLYVINAQPKHEGIYTCTARTPFNKVSASAYLTVKGPPRRAAGVFTLSDTITQNATGIVWTAPRSGTQDITHYVIQVANEFEPGVFQDMKKVTAGESVHTSILNNNRHLAVVDTLNPGTSYQFRVLGINAYGRGIPSDPSRYARTLSAAPVVAPRNVGGGGGSVGDLTIRWEPLHRSEYGAKTLFYRVYWREEDNKNGLWRMREIQDPEMDFFVVQVGVFNYYLPYQAKIQAVNEMGHGPNSTEVTVMSAEDLPIGTPVKVETDTYNSTAIEVTWVPVPDDRLHVRGKIKGYQINYWPEDEDPDDYFQFIRYYGQLDQGLAIGLIVDANYIMDVQVYNRAGLGPRSEKYIMETSGFAPLHYPQEVRISSVGRNRARIWWRGISITTSEEALEGYGIWVWVASENPRTARLIETGEIVFQYIIDGIEKNTLYALRVAAIGGGGYGKKSPTMYFTMEGQVYLDSIFAATVDTFMSKGAMLKATSGHLIVAVLAAILSVYATLSS